MSKKATVLNADIRQAVKQAFDLFDEKAPGLPHLWNQTMHAIAVGFAAESHFKGNGKADRKSFTKAFNESGFLGNASQFRQALENLSENDSLKIEAGIGDLMADA